MLYAQANYLNILQSRDQWPRTPTTELSFKPCSLLYYIQWKVGTQQGQQRVILIYVH